MLSDTVDKVMNTVDKLNKEYVEKQPILIRVENDFNIGIGQIDGFVTFVKKHGLHIQHTVGGKVVQD